MTGFINRVQRDMLYVVVNTGGGGGGEEGVLLGTGRY